MSLHSTDTTALRERSLAARVLDYNLHQLLDGKHVDDPKAIVDYLEQEIAEATQGIGNLPFQTPAERLDYSTRQLATIRDVLALQARGQRVINGVHLHAGVGEDIAHGHNEDGPYTYRVNLVSVIAETQHGREFLCIVPFETLREAVEYLEALPETFSPDDHLEFYFSRNQYGSRAYVFDGDEEAQIEREREPAGVG